MLCSCWAKEKRWRRSNFESVHKEQKFPGGCMSASFKDKMLVVGGCSTDPDISATMYDLLTLSILCTQTAGAYLQCRICHWLKVLPWLMESDIQSRFSNEHLRVGSSGYHLSCSDWICPSSIILDIFLVSKYIQPGWGVAIYASYASCTSVIQYGDLRSLPWHICPQAECSCLNIWLLLVHHIQLAADRWQCVSAFAISDDSWRYGQCVSSGDVCISAPPVDDNMPLQSHQSHAFLQCNLRVRVEP